MESPQTQRMTKQRKIILEEIHKLREHPTADEIYARVREKLPRISMGTVYRNLEILANSGLIRKLDPGLPQMRFEGNMDEHYHITCTQCGKIEDAPIGPLKNTVEDLEKALGNMTKHGIFGHKLEFIGLCKECLKKK